MRRVAAAAALAVVALAATGCPNTAHPKIGSACSKPGRTAQTDGGTNVVCTGGHWRTR